MGHEKDHDKDDDKNDNKPDSSDPTTLARKKAEEGDKLASRNRESSEKNT